MYTYIILIFLVFSKFIEKMDILRSFQCDPIILYLSARRSNNLFPVVNTLTLNTIFRVFIYHPLRYFTDITSRNCDTIVAPSIRWDDTYHKHSGLAIKPNRNIWITFFVKKRQLPSLHLSHR